MIPFVSVVKRTSRTYLIKTFFLDETNNLVVPSYPFTWINDHAVVNSEANG